MPTPPKYFGFYCNQSTLISDIAIHSYDSWMVTIHSSGPCSISGCIDYVSKKSCTCSKCDEGLLVTSRGYSCDIDLALKEEEEIRMRMQEEQEKIRKNARIARELETFKNWNQERNSLSSFGLVDSMVPVSDCCGSEIGVKFNDWVEFANKKLPVIRVSKIMGICGDSVDMIGFEYEDRAEKIYKKEHGSQAGPRQYITVDSNDHIVQAVIFSNSTGISRVVFKTTSKVFSCGEIKSDSESYNIEVERDEEILFLKGYETNKKILKLSLLKAKRAKNSQVFEERMSKYIT